MRLFQSPIHKWSGIVTTLYDDDGTSYYIVSLVDIGKQHTYEVRDEDSLNDIMDIIGEVEYNNNPLTYDEMLEKMEAQQWHELNVMM